MQVFKSKKNIFGLVEDKLKKWFMPNWRQLFRIMNRTIFTSNPEIGTKICAWNNGSPSQGKQEIG